MPGVDHPHRAAPAARWGAACWAEAFRGVDRLVARLYARYDALLEHERDPFVTTPERVAGLLSEVRAAAGRLTAPGGTLARIAAENIREVLGAFDARVRTERDFPHQYISHVARRVTALPRLDPRPDAERADVLAALVPRAAAVLDAAAGRAVTLPRTAARWPRARSPD